MPLDERQRLKLAIAITGVLALVLIFMIWREIRQISDLQTKIADSETKLSDLSIEVADLSELLAERAFLEQTLEEDVKILPDEKEVADFLYTLDDVREEAKVSPNVQCKPQLFTTLKPPKGSGLVPHTWELTVDGPFAALVKFVNLFEIHEQFFRVDGFEIKQSLDDPDERNMKLKITTFTYEPKGKDAPK